MKVKKVFAVADVMPSDCDYLTAGKEYEVSDENELGGLIDDDRGTSIDFCWSCSKHLDNGDWRRVEREVEVPDADAPVSPVAEATVTTATAVSAYDLLKAEYDKLLMRCETAELDRDCYKAERDDARCERDCCIKQMARWKESEKRDFVCRYVLKCDCINNTTVAYAADLYDAIAKQCEVPNG